MEILDAQVHCWLADRPSRPWDPGYRPAYLDRLQYLAFAGQTASAEQALVDMAEAGVDGAVLVPVGNYGLVSDYELEQVARFPRKFTAIGLIDHLAPDLEERLSREAAVGLRGVRLLGLRESDRHDRDEFRRILAACAELNLVVALSLSHPLDQRIADLFREFAQVQFVIDHLGVGIAPPLLGGIPTEPFATLPAVVALAAFANVSVKVSGAPSLSRERYPFRDIWSGIERLADAFGTHRLLWGSDYTRTNGLHSYWEGTHYLAQLPFLDDHALAAIYGGNLRRVVGWTDPLPTRSV